MQDQEDLELADEEADGGADGDELPFVLFEGGAEEAFVLDGGHVLHLADDGVAHVEGFGGVGLDVPSGVGEELDGAAGGGGLHLLVAAGADGGDHERLGEAGLGVDGALDLVM